MVQAMYLIFSLFDATSAQEVPFGIRSTYNAFFMDLPVPSFAFHLSLLTAKSVDSVVAHNGFIFTTGYFNYIVAFQILLRFNDYFDFQMIINILRHAAFWMSMLKIRTRVGT